MGHTSNSFAKTIFHFDTTLKKMKTILFVTLFLTFITSTFSVFQCRECKDYPYMDFPGRCAKDEDTGEWNEGEIVECEGSCAFGWGKDGTINYVKKQCTGETVHPTSKPGCES